ncbi:hypothetical protein HNQ50_001783 [Silvimonas terrae]|uniref:Uncharacterized protein n=1 Tax=Silvimonas terrae TaxID=300266 RepID=A0A840RF81_9NEIS|nr:hypothetical protein [Silvimonas terrae]
MFANITTPDSRYRSIRATTWFWTAKATCGGQLDSRLRGNDEVVVGRATMLASSPQNKKPGWHKAKPGFHTT